MSGGLMQLVAYGAQDIYLTGNPQITFFKVVYRRHTNFSCESIEQTFNGSVSFGSRVTCNVSRNGDLIHRMYLQMDLPAVTNVTGEFSWVEWVGHALVKSVEVEIGGQKIDKHYSDWLHIWNELTQTAGHKAGYEAMVGNDDALTVASANDKPAYTLYVPLQFWFCRNPGLALPLIALQYHEVKINIEFREKSDLYKLTGAGAAATIGELSASLFVDYIYLDTQERRRFAQSAHEYLIEQLQFTGDESTSSTNNQVKLNFNHPTKELIWVVQKDSTRAAKNWFNYTTIDDVSATNPGDNTLASAKLMLNGHDRFSSRNGKYFNLVQPYQHHENVPSTGIYVYSFCLKPEEQQPSGTCNFSRIDNATLSMQLVDGVVAGGAQANVRVYAVSYNVLRIMSGMGGLAYAN